MVRLETLRGYLLEEVLAWLLRSSGYRLLTEQDDSARPPWKVLEKRKHGLVVRGRGAWHQADTLGEFQYVPPFSLPIRLFAEAKFTRIKVGLPTVRNGHGVVHDLNENVVTTLSNGSGPHRPRTRYHYSYAIFSTSGFTQDAQEFALAHQISLIDLSLPDFRPLRDLVRVAAKSVYDAMKPMPRVSGPLCTRSAIIYDGTC
ncbi:restriction endonuclease [Streptomyces cahuitamycinicus]|uniref:restriction endonuclease n=1 Tax=Streptomyces cahuitamycinicus TaxID=2070367 RepID=UPI001FEAABE4|nr:restriction endonuclease [Streptomyces cahuitamycinicus]